MPTTNSNIELFSLAGDKSWEGKTNGKVGAKLQGDLNLAAEFCHGVKFDLSFEAGAQVEFMIGALGAALRAQGQVYVGAGIRAIAQYNPNIFEEMGLKMELAAYIEASVAGSLGVSLNIGELIHRIQGNHDTIVSRSAIKFLESAEFEAGVWGKASFAASARAFFNVYGTFLPENNQPAGFVFEAGASAGLLAGAGWDFYLRANLPDPRQLYLDLSRLLTDELLEQLPYEQQDLKTTLEFSLGLGFETLYEIAEVSVKQKSIRWEQLREQLCERFIEHLKTTLQSHIRDIIEQEISNVGAELYDFLIDGNASQGIQEARQQLDQILANFQKPYTKRKLGQMLKQVLPLLPRLGIPRKQAEEAITFFWCIQSLWEDDFVAPPAILWNKAKAILPSHLGSQYNRETATFYVLEKLEDILQRSAPPELQHLLHQLERSLQLSLSDIFAIAIASDWQSAIGSTALFSALQRYITDGLRSVALEQAIPEIRKQTPANSTRRELVDDVLTPSLTVLTAMFDDHLNTVATGAAPLDAVLEEFQKGAGALVSGVVGRSLSIVGNEIMEFVLEELHTNLNNLSKQYRNPRARGKMFDSFGHVVPKTATQINFLQSTFNRALRKLLAEIIDVASEAFGPNIWTPQRLATQKRATNAIMSNLPSKQALAAPNGVRLFLAEQANCSIDFNQSEREQLGKLYEIILAEEFELMVSRLPGIVTEFFAALLEAPLQLFEDAVDEIKQWHKEQQQKAIKQRQEAHRQYLAQRAKFFKELNKLKDALSALAKLFSNKEKRDAFINKLIRKGEIELIRLVGNNQTTRNTILPAYRSFMGQLRPLIHEVLKEIAPWLRFAADLVSALAAARNAETLDAFIKKKAQAKINKQPGGSLLPDELKEFLAEQLILIIANTEYKKQQQLAKVTSSKLTGLDSSTKAKKLSYESGKAEEAIAIKQRAIQHLTPDSLHLVYPAKLDKSGLKRQFVHAGDVELEFDTRGVKSDQLRSDQFRCFVNGVPYSVNFNLRKKTNTDQWTVRTLIPFNESPLQAGTNHVEIAYTNGKRTTRTSNVCLVDPQSSSGSLVILPEKSQFDAKGNDHKNLKNEFVVIQNVSDSPIQLLDWRMHDLARHFFRFPAYEIQPGEELKIITGSGRNRKGVLHWKQKRAVWNNTGDSVFIVDPQHVLQAQFAYKK